MAAIKWYSVYNEEPADMSTVWFKSWYQTNYPMQGTYLEATKSFKSRFSSIEWPAYSIYKWAYRG